MHSRFFLLLCVLTLGACSVPTTKSAEIRLNIYTEPPSLDPRKMTDSTSSNVLLMLFDGLTRMGKDHKPHPAIAKRIDVSDDLLTYTFHLRRAKWSNGDPVTAEDFAYAWKSVLDPKFPALFAYKLYPIKNAQKIREGKLPADQLGVKIIDDKTIEVTLDHPTPYFLELTAFPTFYPVNKRVVEANPLWAAEAGANYVSNGPFKLDSWEHDSEIILSKNSNYWDAKAVKLKKIYLVMIDDTTTEHYMYEMGELDWAGSPFSNLSPEFIPTLKKEGKLLTMPASGTYFFKLNTNHTPLGNIKIRRALALAIDRQAIIDHVLQGEQRPATALVPPMPGWENASELFSRYDPREAKRLFDEGLDELDMTRDEFPTLKLSYNSSREHEKVAQTVQHQWREVLGVHTTLEKSDWKVYLAKVSRQDFEIARSGWLGDYYDPASFLIPFQYKENSAIGGSNETGWENAEYQHLLELAEQERDLKKRAAYLRQAEEILIKEMPIIPLFYINLFYMKKPNVKNVYISPLGMADFKEASVE